MEEKNYFITAIGTDSGKTVISAIVAEATGYNYWKPIQSGNDCTDREVVTSLVSNPNFHAYPETYLFKTPVSPHAAAEIEDISIDFEKITLPQSDPLVIEGAGGVLVPLSYEKTIADLIPQLNAEIILVSNFYLGSINHTLLTINELKRRNTPIKGLIFNGKYNPASAKAIKEIGNVKILLHVDQELYLDKEIIKKYAQELKNKL